MSWRLAESLHTLLSQVNTRYPGRRKDSDGTIGDEAHSARKSDHNVNPAGFVCALDVTHDPASGCDSRSLVEGLIASRDPRIQYVISNRQIANAKDGFIWRPYNGQNPHDHHCHISVKQDPKYYNDPRSWDLSHIPPPKAVGPILAPPPRTVRYGDHNSSVTEVQTKLHIKADGVFGPETKAAVQKLQKAHGLVDDGIIGPQTWAILKGSK